MSAKTDLSKSKDPEPCPTCGTCPTCGHAAPAQPVVIPMPYPYPVYPQPVQQPAPWQVSPNPWTNPSPIWITTAGQPAVTIGYVSVSYTAGSYTQ